MLTDAEWVPAQTTKVAATTEAAASTFPCGSYTALSEGREDIPDFWRMVLSKARTWLFAKWASGYSALSRGALKRKKATPWLQNRLDDWEREKYERLVWALDCADTIRQTGGVGITDQQYYLGRYTIGHRVL